VRAEVELPPIETRHPYARSGENGSNTKLYELPAILNSMRHKMFQRRWNSIELIDLVNN